MEEHKIFRDYLVGDNYIALQSEAFDTCPFADDPDFLELTVIQQKFIIGYGLRDLRGWSIARCYQFASPTDCTSTSAAVLGMRMMSLEKMKPFYKKWDRILVERFSQTADRIMQEEQAIAYSDIMDFLDDDGLIKPEILKRLPRTTTAAISSIEVIEQVDGSVKYKLRLWDKSSSLARMERIKNMNPPERSVVIAGVHEIPEGADPVEASKVYSDLLRGVDGD